MTQGGINMDYQKLGKTDFSVSRIVYGCWELGGKPWKFKDDENSVHVLRTAYENRITTFDTAEGYGDGHSEEVLGRAVKEIRKDCIIATKVSPNHLRPQDVRTSIEGSLKRLGTDYVDIYYIHWPNNEIPLEDTISEFNKLKREGLIRAIGVSNFSLEQVKQGLKYGDIDVIQPEYSLLQRDIEKGLLQFCRENSISVLSYSSIAKGILTGAFHLYNAVIKEDDFRSTRRLFLPEHLEKEKELIYAMKEIADKKVITLSQLAISWLLHQEGLTGAIVGTQEEKHLIDNIKSLEVALTDDEIQKLGSISSKVLHSL
jgi:myo-inositol catabolism protein IolS